jgi:hypothetical protein
MVYYNSAELFLKEYNRDDVVNHDRDSIFKDYRKWCIIKDFEPIALNAFSRIVCKTFNLKTGRRRIEHKLTTFFFEKR